MKLKIFIVLIILAILSIFFVHKPISDNQKTIKINNTEYKAIVVDNDATREKGLSGRVSLPLDTVMLFTFDNADRYGIWMKDMKFPIDIIWLDENGKIVEIKENVSPKTFPETFFPPSASLFIIEANTGFAEKNGLKVGNRVDNTPFLFLTEKK